MSSYDLSHVMDGGVEFSSGPAVGWWDMLTQSARQQYRVGSQLGFDEELRTRWEQSLQALRDSGQNFHRPIDPLMYRNYARFVRDGTPVTMPVVEGTGYGARITDEQQPHTDFIEMQRANEAIRQLNNPQVKTFEQILEEVGQAQREIEEQTASMRERAPTGSFFAELLGGAAGSFTLRDPLNLATLPIGFGRTIAMRIATDVGVAMGVTAATEYGDIVPNRALAGLPEHNPLVDIGLAGFGAGVIRGGGELAGVGLRTLRARGDAARIQENIDFNLHDSQLQQMFASIDTPTARAGASILDDTIFFERTNPYGEGQVAGYRWQAELEATARAINGEEEPAAPLPPMPSEYVDRALSFQTVRETAPELWNELETARTRLNELDNQIGEATARELSIPDAVRLVDEEAAAKLDKLSEVVNDMSVPEPIRAAADMEARTTILRVGQDKIMDAVTAADIKAKHEVRTLRASRKAANKKYRQAYQKVEKEAQRLEMAEVAKRSEAQAQSIDVVGPHIVSEPMTGPLTRKDFVEQHVARTEEADAAIPAAADAVYELKMDMETNTVDIGTKTPVSADFKVPFEDGELSVREILDDLTEDKRLEEAVKGCAI